MSKIVTMLVERGTRLQQQTMQLKSEPDCNHVSAWQSVCYSTCCRSRVHFDFLAARLSQSGLSNQAEFPARMLIISICVKRFNKPQKQKVWEAALGYQWQLPLLQNTVTPKASMRWYSRNQAVFSKQSNPFTPKTCKLIEQQRMLSFGNSYFFLNIYCNRTIIIAELWKKLEYPLHMGKFIFSKELQFLFWSYFYNTNRFAFPGAFFL